MPNDPIYFALLEALAQPGCPVCRLVHASVEHFLDSLFYEMVNDAGMRRQLRRSLGFCKEHVHLLLDTQLRDALGLSIIYQDILGQVLDGLLEVGSAADSLNSLDVWLGRLSKGLSDQVESSVQALSPQESCPACRQQEQSARLTTQVLLERLQEQVFRQALDASSGLCLPHMRLALENIHSGEQFNRLVGASRLKLQVLHDELAEFIRKSDHRFSQEGFGAEGDAYRRAMELFTGTE